MEQIIKLKKSGWIQQDIADKIGVSRSAVRYHVDKNFKKAVIKNSAERKKLPEEKEKTRQRMNKKYHKDKSFRKKQIERSKKYNTKNIEKRKEIQQKYWNKNKDKITEQRIKKKQSDTRKAKILFGAFLLCLLTVIAMTFILVGYAVWIVITGG